MNWPRPENLSPEALRRLEAIVDREMIGGQPPVVTLRNLEQDSPLLSDTEFMVAYFNEAFRKRGSSLRVKPVERYWYKNYHLGDSVDLALYDERDDESVRLIYFLWYAPKAAVVWQPQATPEEFARKRQAHLDNLEQERLRENGKVELERLATRVALMVRVQLNRCVPSVEQARHLATILPYPGSVEKLEGSAYICQIMGFNFHGIVAEAARALAQGE